VHEANQRLAALFGRIADMLEIQGGNRFRVLAYRRAAGSLSVLAEEIGEIVRRGEEQKVLGIGKDLAAKMREFVETGRLAYYERISREVPESLADLLQIRGLGPKTLALFRERLGIEDLAGLERALTSGALAGLPGVKEKTVENLRRGIGLFRRGVERKPLGAVWEGVESLRAEVARLPGVKRVEAAGSYRRRRETVGDVDLLAVAEDGEAAVRRFAALPAVRRVLARGETKGSVEIEGGLQVDLRVVPQESFGAALQYFTGSQAHGVKVREIAKRKGLKLNEYGVFKGERRVAGEEEEGVYRALGLPFIPPELREDRGEVEAALQGRLPGALVTLGDIQGDLHAHSTWSDGRSTLEEMAGAAAALGHKYLAIADHSRSSRIARGLTLARLEEKREAVAALAERTKRLVLLMGAEVDILPDGALDYPEEVLLSLDVVVASIHSAMGQGREKMTGRILKALDRPGVHILGHPTGRLLGERDPIEVDMERVLERCAERGVAVEVSASWQRLDLNDVQARRAAELGCLLAINSDAHEAGRLSNLHFGVAQACRGWVERDRVINCWPWAKLKKWLEGRREG